MKTSNAQWLLGMCVPVVVFGGLATWLSRSQPEETRDDGPFALVVDKVRSVPATAYNASQGHEFAFELLLKSRGEKPQWWGQPISSRSAQAENTTPQAPCRVVIVNKDDARPLKNSFLYWTTHWDGNLQCYTARLELDGSKIPRGQEVRWQGRVAIEDYPNPPVSPTIRYEVRLKKAGESWQTPQFSRDPQLRIRGVKINATSSVMGAGVGSGKHEAHVTVSSPDGGNQLFGFRRFEDAQGHEIDFHDPAAELPTAFSVGSSHWHPILSSPTDKAEIGIFFWNPAELRAVSRDVFIVGRTSARDRWPLEFTFPIKRNGKILCGNVPVTARPAPIESD